jgi:hypothetical protein
LVRDLGQGQLSDIQFGALDQLQEQAERAMVDFGIDFVSVGVVAFKQSGHPVIILVSGKKA